MPAKIKPIPGTTYGHWTVLSDGPIGSQKLHCRCVCGTEKLVGKYHVKSGASNSCGCIKSQGPLSHGASAVGATWQDKKIYAAWRNIRQRTTNPNNSHFQAYKGRGMSDDLSLSFPAFARAAGTPTDKSQSLDRIDNNLGYVEGNLRWATTTQQARNKGNNRLVEFKGETLSLAEWSERVGVSRALLSARLGRLGWPVDKALATPSRGCASRTLTHLGETLPLAVWADRYGLEVETLSYRISVAGWAVEDALTGSVREPAPNPVLEYGGEQHTIEEWAVKFNLPLSTLRQRLGKLGWSIEDALNRPVGAYKRKILC